MNHMHNRVDAILLAAHGSVIPEAARAYEHLQARFAAAYAPIPVRLTITSKRGGGKLAGQGRAIPLFSETLASMHAEGFSKIAVQSLYVAAAEVFQKMRNDARIIAPDIIIGSPLMGCEADIPSFADAVSAILPPERRPDDAVILMGHGRIDGIADPLYLSLAKELQRRDRHIFLSNLVGSLDFNSRRKEIRAAGIRRVWMQSLLIAVGHHVTHDMFGSHAESLRSQLVSDGIEVIPILKGLGEYDIIAELLISRLRNALISSSDKNI